MTGGTGVPSLGGKYLEKWKEACKKKQSRTKGVEENEPVDLSAGKCLAWKCGVKSCKKGYYPDRDKSACYEKWQCHEYVDEKKGEIAEEIKNRADNIQVGDEYDFNTYEYSIPEIKSALEYWVKKCTEIQMINGTAKFVDAQRIGADNPCLKSHVYRCLINTCENGYTKNDTGTKCISEEETTVTENASQSEEIFLKDVESLSEAFDDFVKSKTEECSDKGGKIQDGLCVINNDT